MSILLSPLSILSLSQHIKDTKTGHMTTYTVRSHPELGYISDYDKEELKKVIRQYKTWYKEKEKESDRKEKNQDAWSYATCHIKDFLDQNMVDALSTLEETHGVRGKGFPTFPVSELFSAIEIIRKELREQTVHPTLLEMEPVLLMDILNKLKICTRRVIQNTSILRLHEKSWVHADALALSGRGGSISHPERMY